IAVSIDVVYGQCHRHLVRWIVQRGDERTGASAPHDGHRAGTGHSHGYVRKTVDIIVELTEHHRRWLRADNQDGPLFKGPGPRAPQQGDIVRPGIENEAIGELVAGHNLEIIVGDHYSGWCNAHRQRLHFGESASTVAAPNRNVIGVGLRHHHIDMTVAVDITERDPRGP